MNAPPPQHNEALWDQEAAALLRSLLSLKTVREARRFIRDLMTEDEIRMVVARWRVARLLAAGRTYRQIEDQTGLSSRTIARISRWLREGEGGYRLLLRRQPQRKKETKTHVS
jgi:TrpR-related protein YerC/YecD